MLYQSCLLYLYYLVSVFALYQLSVFLISVSLLAQVEVIDGFAEVCEYFFFFDSI